MISEEEFKKFIGELYKQGKAQGISEDVLTTIIAETIKRREDSVNKDEVVEIKTETIVRPQMLYGPPPVTEVHYIEKRPQILYGPPPVQEFHHIEKGPQLLYGPPKR